MSDDFRVGNWLVQPSLNTISRNGTTTRLEPKVMEVLVCLAAHAGEALTKEQLLQEVWQETFVSEDVLKHSISELRRVLKDDARDPHVIQTIPKRGYRLVALVERGNGTNYTAGATVREPVGDTGTATGTRTWWTMASVSVPILLLAVLIAVPRKWLHGELTGAELPEIHSLAVLPMQNFSSDPSQEYFSDGLTDALITDLAQIGSVKVISRTSSSKYKKTTKSLPEIAHELNVDGIIEGTVQRSGDRVRVTAQLIQGRSDSHLWANSYERDLRDIFTLEREITGDIASQVRARITNPDPLVSPQPRPLNLNALDLYLRGNYHLNKAFLGGPRDVEMRTAGEFFQRAIDADPGFAPAYIGLADAHDVLLSPTPEDLAIMREAAEKAAALDVTSSSARAEVAGAKWEAWEWAGAEEDFRRALKMNPNNAEAHSDLGDLLDATGRLQEGWKEHELAQALDPVQSRLEWALYRRGEYDGAMKFLQSRLESRPEDPALHWLLSEIYAQKGLQKEWVQELGRGLERTGYRDVAGRLRREFVRSGYMGSRRQLAKELERMAATKQMYLPGVMAQIYAGLGDKDRAFYWLREGVNNHYMAMSDPVLQWTKIDPGLANLRSDPRFTDLLHRMGFPP